MHQQPGAREGDGKAVGTLVIGDPRNRDGAAQPDGPDERKHCSNCFAASTHTA